MIKSLLKTTWRNLTRHKAFSAINIAGLSLGIAACLFILQYVSFQLSYDRFHKNAGSIYRVIDDRLEHGKVIQHSAITYSGVGQAMQQDFPEVVNHCRMVPFKGQVISANGKQFPDESGFAVDNAFLSMFSFPVLAGDGREALMQDHSIVLSERLANKVFGCSDCRSLVGQTVQISRDPKPYTITGITMDIPENSSIQFSFLVSYPTIVTLWGMPDYGFDNPDSYHYVQLGSRIDPRKLETKFPAFEKRYLSRPMELGTEDKLSLQPLLKSHLYSDLQYEIGATASATAVWSLLSIAVLIIVMAWFNYINLAAGRSIDRAKEVGIRKISGAGGRQLAGQFLIESCLVNMVALGLALFLVVSLQHPFNEFIHLRLSLGYLFAKGTMGYLIPFALGCLMVGGTVLSGLYPAVALTTLAPITILKGKFKSSTRGLFIRKTLVISQFTVTIGLCCGSIVVFQQMRYVQQQQLGMNIDQVLIVRPPKQTLFDSTFIARENSFKDEVKKIVHVKEAATSWRIAGDDLLRDEDVAKPDAGTEQHYQICRNGISSEYLDVYQIPLLAGRSFDAADYLPTDPRLQAPRIILNKSAASLLGFDSPAAAIGREISTGTSRSTIIGVVSDYHQKSLHYAIEPVALLPSYTNWSPISIRVDVSHVDAVMDAIKAKYRSFFPGNPFEYYFLDEKFNAQYKEDRLFSQLFVLFSGFAIFVACLGILGLTMLSVAQRVKEIAIRKVLGASGFNIARLLTINLIGLILLSFLIASPVAWWFMDDWLQHFAYRIQIKGWYFAAAGLLALAPALSVASFQVIRTAWSNPIKSLRAD